MNFLQEIIFIEIYVYIYNLYQKYMNMKTTFEYT